MRTGKQFIRADDGELVAVTHVVSMKIKRGRAVLQLTDGRDVAAPFPLRLMVLPPSILMGQSADVIPVRV